MFRLINLETLTILAYTFRDSEDFALLIKRLTFVAYYFKASKCYALLIQSL